MRILLIFAALIICCAAQNIIVQVDMDVNNNGCCCGSECGSNKCCDKEKEDDGEMDKKDDEEKDKKDDEEKDKKEDEEKDKNDNPEGGDGNNQNNTHVNNPDGGVGDNTDGGHEDNTDGGDGDNTDDGNDVTTSTPLADMNNHGGHLVTTTTTTTTTEEAIPTTCPTGFKYKQYQGYCYFHTETLTKWDGGEARCREEAGAGFHFFVPLDATMATNLNGEVLKTIPANHWAGIHAVGGVWKTYDDKTPAILPTGGITNCAFYMTPSGFSKALKFTSADCTMEKGVFCGFKLLVP